MMIQQPNLRLSGANVKVAADPPLVRPDAPGLDLRDLAAMTARRKAWLVVPVLLALVAALAYGALVPPRFAATTQLLIDPRGLHIVQNELTPSQQVTEASLTLVESQMHVITSEGVLRRVVETLNLDQDPDLNRRSPLSALADAVRGLFGIARPDEDPVLKAIRLLQRRITVKRAERSYAVDVTAEAETRDGAARLANAVASAFIESETEANSRAARKVSDMLGGRLEELRERVRKAEERVEKEKAKNNIVGASGRLVSEQQLTDLNTQLAAAQARASEFKVRSEQIERLRKAGIESDTVVEALQSTSINLLRQQLAEAQRRQSEASTLLGPRHPDIGVIEAQIRTYRQRIKEELSRIAATTRTDYERARQNEAALQRSLDQKKREAQETSRAFVRVRELEREAEAVRAVYEAFLKRTREVAEQQSVDVTNVRVISTAVPPVSPSNPPFPVVLVAALMGGLGAGAVAGLLRDQFSARVGSRRALAAATGLPVMLSLPRSALRRAAGSDGPVADERVAAGLRRLRSKLAGQSLGGAMPQSVLLAPILGLSASWSLAPMLAAVAAEGGDRVLLIEAHRRAEAPSPAEQAGRHLGLTDVLAGRASLAETVRRDEAGSFDRLTPGRVGSSQRASAADIHRRILSEAAGYNLIVVDGSGLLDDVGVLAWNETVGASIVTVEEGATAMAAVVDAAETLRQRGAPLQGVVLIERR